MGARRNTELHQEVGPPTARSDSCRKFRARRSHILGKGHAEGFRLATLSVSGLLVTLSFFPRTDLSHPPLKIFFAASLVSRFHPLLLPSSAELTFEDVSSIKVCEMGVGGCWRDQADGVLAGTVPQVVSTQTSPRWRLQAREQTSVCAL